MHGPPPKEQACNIHRRRLHASLPSFLPCTFYPLVISPQFYYAISPVVYFLTSVGQKAKNLLFQKKRRIEEKKIGNKMY